MTAREASGTRQPGEPDALTTALDERAQQRELHLLRSMVLLLRSTDVGDALHSFMDTLRDELELDDVTISVMRDPTAPDGDAERRPPTVDGSADGGDLLPIAPGEMFTLVLRRGDRTVGHLSARARDEVSPTTLASLTVLCDVLAVALDTTRVLHDEQRTVAGLRELAELKARFLGSVTHELRTSVTIIEGFAMLLSRQAPLLDERQRADFVARIWNSARSLGSLVEDLLDLTRLESSGINLVIRSVDLSGLVPKIVGQMSVLLERNTVLTSVAPDVVALTDPGSVERILTNLLSNAAKYTPAGTEIAVSLRASAGQAVLTVADRGPGIPASERRRVFDRFYRVDDGGAAAARGMGIGLALVRDLVDLNSGSIIVDETPGGGARFSVSLPLADPLVG
ncbi:MAG: sensor histidine kinase [Microthrixaceae bacterium]